MAESARERHIMSFKLYDSNSMRSMDGPSFQRKITRIIMKDAGINKVSDLKAGLVFSSNQTQYIIVRNFMFREVKDDDAHRAWKNNVHYISINLESQVAQVCQTVPNNLFNRHIEQVEEQLSGAKLENLQKKFPLEKYRQFPFAHSHDDIYTVDLNEYYSSGKHKILTYQIKES